MKFVKRFFIAVFVIIVLALLAGLFMKKEYSIERSVAISAPKDVVFNYIKHIKNQDYYSTWNKKDPAMKKDYKGTDGEIGFVSSWVGNKDVGTGEQEIKGIKDGERIDMELRFKEPMEMTNTAYMTTESEGENQTKVKWGFNGKMNYPMNVMMPFLGMDKMLGDELQSGLNDLKAIMEAAPAAAPAATDTTSMEKAVN